MTRTERIVRNISSNWVGFAINALVTLALTPFVLGHLGIERYGIWVLINSFVGYYGMLDLGFRAGVNQFLTRSVAVEDYSRANVVMSTALALLALLAALIVILTIVAAFLVPKWFDLPAGDQQEAFICILLVGGAAAWQIALSPFAAVFVAVQRFDISNLIGISMRLLGAVGIVLALQRGFGLIGVAAITASMTVLEFLVRCIVATRLLPSISISFQSIQPAELRNIGSFGLWNFLMSVTSYIYLHLLPIVVAAFMPVAAVGHYALAAAIWHQLYALINTIGQVVYPVAAELHAKQEQQILNRLFVDGTRLLQLVVLPVVLVAFMWADDFYRLWIGEEFLSGDPFVSVASLLRVMLVCTLIGYVSNIAHQILLGAGRIRSLSILKSSGALLTLILTAALISDLGLVAIPLSVLVSVFLVDVVAIPLVLYREEGLDLREVVHASWLRLSLVFVSLATVFAAINLAWQALTWTALIIQGVAAGVCIIAAVWFIGIKPSEREELVLQPIRKIRGKI